MNPAVFSPDKCKQLPAETEHWQHSGPQRPRNHVRTTGSQQNRQWPILGPTVGERLDEIKGKNRAQLMWQQAHSNSLFQLMQNISVSVSMLTYKCFIGCIFGPWPAYLSFSLKFSCKFNVQNSPSYSIVICLALLCLGTYFFHNLIPLITKF